MTVPDLKSNIKMLYYEKAPRIKKTDLILF